MEVNWWRFDWWRFTQGGGALSAWLPHPPLLLLAEQPADGRLDALLLAGLVERILTAVGAAAVRRETVGGGRKRKRKRRTRTRRGRRRRRSTMNTVQNNVNRYHAGEFI